MPPHVNNRNMRTWICRAISTSFSLLLQKSIRGQGGSEALIPRPAASFWSKPQKASLFAKGRDSFLLAANCIDR